MARVDGSRGNDDICVYPMFGVTIYRGGAFSVIGAGASLPPAPVGAARGLVTTMSAASRRRLLYLCARLRVDAVRRALFITLTYPARYPGPAEAKRHLDVFWKRAQRAFPCCSAIWRMEPQRRGAPHFHLLVFGAGYVDKAWLSEQWYTVVGSGDERHLRAGTNVQRPERVESLISYIGKELTGEKPGHFADCETGELQACGRCWGVLNKKLLPLVEPERWHVPVEYRDKLLDRLAGRLGFDALKDYPLTRTVFLAHDDVRTISDVMLSLGAVDSRGGFM